MLRTWSNSSGLRVRWEERQGARAGEQVGSRRNHGWVLLGWKELAWFKVAEKDSRLRREKGHKRKIWPSPGREKMLFGLCWKGGEMVWLRELLGLQELLFTVRRCSSPRPRTEEELEEMKTSQGQVTCPRCRAR